MTIKLVKNYYNITKHTEINPARYFMLRTCNITEHTEINPARYFMSRYRHLHSTVAMYKINTTSVKMAILQQNLH